MARPRRPDGSRPINPRTAAHTHEVTYDRDEEDEEGRRPLYQAIVLRSERQADDFGVRYAPGEHTALVVRFRRSIVTSRRRIDMEVSDFITVRRISDDKEERAVIKTFRQHRRYPKQKYCDTGVIECSRLDVVV